MKCRSLTVNSLIIENEPAAVLNFLSGSQWLQLSSILRHLMIFSVLNSRHSRHSRHSRRRRRGSVARSVSPAWGGAPAHRGGAPGAGRRRRRWSRKAVRTTTTTTCACACARRFARTRCLTTAVAARRKMIMMKPFLDLLGLISAYF